MPYIRQKISGNEQTPDVINQASDELKENYKSLVLNNIQTFCRLSHIREVIMFIPETDTIPRGFQYFYTYVSHDQTRIKCEMWGLFVEEQFRNKKIGTNLLREATKRAYEKGARIFIFRLTMKNGEKEKWEEKIATLQKEEFPDCFFGKPWIGNLVASFDEKTFM